MTSRPHYEDDLAYIHNTGYRGYIEGCAPGVLELLGNAGIREGLVVDVGCGGGYWAKRLVDAGYRALGLDISAAMIETARRVAPAAEFHVGSLWSYRFPPCRAVTALGEVFCYLADRSASRTRLKSLFQKIFRALGPDGMLIFDVSEVGLGKNQPRTFAEGDDWACLVDFEYDEAREQLTRHITAFRQHGGFYRRCREQHVVQLYRSRDVARLLREVGFRVRIVRQIGSQPMLPNRAGFIARKP